MQDGWQRRLAAHLASQLPEEPEDAKAVIEYLRRIAEGFLFEPPPDQGCRLLPLRRPSIS